MKERIKNLTHLLGFFALGVALIAVYKTFDNFQIIWDFIWKLFDILSPFVIGFALAFLLFAPVNFLEKKVSKAKPRLISKHARAFSVLLVYVALPGYFDQLMKTLEALTEENGLLAGMNLTDTVNNLYTSYIVPLLKLENAPAYFKGLMDFTSSLLNIFMALIISVYMLLSRESLVRACKLVCSLFIPERPMAVLAKYIHRSCDILYNYFYSQVLDALLVSIIMTVGCFIFRAPAPVALGFMIGLMNLIPYFGAIIGGVAAVAITLLSGNLYRAILLAVYIVGMQQLDANILQPRIVGDKVGIKPIYVLLAITLGGGLFGFWGIFLGVPTIAIIQMLLIDIIRYRRRKAHPPETVSSEGGEAARENLSEASENLPEASENVSGTAGDEPTEKIEEAMDIEAAQTLKE